MADGPLALGIDAGTTKVAAVVTDPAGRQLAVRSVEHRADLPAPAGHSLQSARLLLGAAFEAVRGLPGDLRARLGAVGVAGQMHGILLLDADGEPVGDLVTWQDQRCAMEEGFLASLARRTGVRLHTGYGCATLAWLAGHGAVPGAAAAAATVHDWIVGRLCGAARPVTDPTDAASLGLFDLRRLEWDGAAVRAAGFPAALLPRVVPTGSRAGAVDTAAARELGVPAGIPVAAAIGDSQASLAAVLARPDREAALALGTGGQLSVAVPRAGLDRWLVDGSAWECRPYLDGLLLVTAASLCAGSAWRWLAEAAASWAREIGAGDVPLDRVYERMNELGMAARTVATVSPHFLGERHDPALRGSITGIGPEPFALGGVARALARGIIRTLREMLPGGVLEGRERAVGGGNALRRNPLLCRMAEEVLGMPLVLTETIEEAAHGASRIAARLAGA